MLLLAAWGRPAGTAATVPATATANRSAAASSVPLSGAPAPAPPPREAVTIGANSTGMNHLWAWWGTKRGIYARHGLDVTPVDNVADAVTALISGQVQFVAHGVQTHSGAVKGLPIRAVMVTFRDKLGVYADPSITTIPALKGKRIIGPYDILKELFKRQGLDPESDVTWVVSRTGVQQQLQMMKEGEAEAASGFPPGKLLAERVGICPTLPRAGKEKASAARGHA